MTTPAAKWTPEPWAITADGFRVYAGDPSTKEGTRGICDTYSASSRYNSLYMPEDRANGARIVACVNACAGIPDPTQLRRQRDELRKVLASMVYSHPLCAKPIGAPGSSARDMYDIQAECHAAARSILDATAIAACSTEGAAHV